MKTVGTLTSALFRYLEEQEIAYCAVGDTRAYPQLIPGDIDLVVEERVLASMPARIQSFCERQDLRLVQCLEHEQNARYFVVSWSGEGRVPAYLAIDVCGDYYRHGWKLLTAEELLADRAPALDECGRPRGFTVAAPAREFIYYLLKRIDKEALGERHAAHLSGQWRRDPDGARSQIERFWDRYGSARLIVRAADTGDWRAVVAMLPRLRAEMHRRLARSPRALLREIGRCWRRLREPTGLAIAVLGPDGSGKSSLLEAVEPMLRGAFRSTARVHLRPRMIGRGGTEPVTRPHGAPDRSAAASLAKLVLFAIDYHLGYLLRVRPSLVRSTLVLFDRYYHDLLADPRRYRYGGSLRFARRLAAFLPGPDLWLVLDAPAQVLQARKQEVPAAESERQRMAYRELLDQDERVVVVDATQSLAQAAADAARAVLDLAVERTAHRLGLAGARPCNPLAARCLLFFCRHRVPFLSRIVGTVFNSDIYCRLPRDVLMPHPYGIVIHSQTRLGRRVTVMQQVTIGAKNPGENLAPVIEDDVYIGAGARVLGAVRVGQRAVIGANAVVTRDVPPHVTVVGANRLVAGPTPPLRAELHR